MKLKPVNEVVSILHSSLSLLKSASNIKNCLNSSLLVSFNYHTKDKPIIDNMALYRKWCSSYGYIKV